MDQIANIEESSKKRVVIVGAGFAGLNLAQELCRQDFQIVLLDKNNYHQFQPLFYQVATAALEPSAISFPLRRIFQNTKKLHFRVCELQKIAPHENRVYTNIGYVDYDYLVIATGADTNFFGNQRIQDNALPMKSISEALFLRNRILENYEQALRLEDKAEQEALMNVVIVGAGPTGVELAGALAELKKNILPKDYPDLDFNCMRVTLVEGGPKILPPFSEGSSAKAREFLEKLGVQIILNSVVKDYDGRVVTLSNNDTLQTHTLIWAAGVTGIKIDGFKEEDYGPGSRLKVNEFNVILGYDNIYALGDIAVMISDDHPRGHPQVAQVAIQQAKNLSKNIKHIQSGKVPRPFKYNDKGSMATIGKKLAVADLNRIKLRGFTAWILWLFVHLFSILGTKNKLSISLNWVWSYFTSDQSLRLLILPKRGKKSE